MRARILKRGAAAVTAAILLGALAASPGSAGDPAAGRKRAVACQTCHGIDGVSKMPDAPNLSGQVEGYLVKALTDFRSGARSNETMSLVAKDLSDADIANLAAHYARIQVEITPPD
ncbi:c-type cytochrome [Methylobacterium sp. C25]|uniref:c-type cytochrome n=1 Tax=Methylobacterium sp. C25 TaxID=2721622 RepID=UPI001F40AB1E|nr:cytochrome c [Methylobacterium sp. C25]